MTKEMYIPLRVIGICNVNVHKILAMTVSYGSSSNRSTDMGPTTYHLCWSHTVMQMLNLQYKDMFRSTPGTCGEETGAWSNEAGAYEV